MIRAIARRDIETVLSIYARVGFKHAAWRDVGWWHRALATPEIAPGLSAPPPPSARGTTT